MKTLNPPRLIANTLSRRTGDFSPVRRTLGHAAPSAKATPGIDARDAYRIADRAIDHVVDRLLEELTW